MEAAWVLFCEEAGQFLHTVKHHRLAGSLPTSAKEWMRRAKGLVTPHRGGSKELRLKGPYQQGGMRSHWSENRRLRAGESFSPDDLTRNVAVWIPWPNGGCPCSEKIGVRLGRWQTLVVFGPHRLHTVSCDHGACEATLTSTSMTRWGSGLRKVPHSPSLDHGSQLVYLLSGLILWLGSAMTTSVCTCERCRRQVDIASAPP
jgi:hypothetical protein